MTELQSWRETFEACGIDIGPRYEWSRIGRVSLSEFEGTRGEGIPANAAIALCRWTAFEWLGYAMIYPNTVTPSGQWCVVRNMRTFEADTIDAALQAACREKAGVR